MSDLSRLEFEALRATIRERGTLRLCAILAGLAVWAALAAAVSITELKGAASLIPLVVLSAAYETSFFVQTGVERVGRYVQVFFEEREKLNGWETTAMEFAARFRGGPDPLFTTLFHLANVMDFAALISWGSPGWTGLSLAAHAVMAYRIVTTKRIASTQRAVDLERFRLLRNR
jgi:hypothetical protein